METDRRLLKYNAKIINATAKPPVPTASLIYVMVLLLFSFLSNYVLTINVTDELSQRYINYYQSGNWDELFNCMAQMIPPNTAYIIKLAIDLALTVVSAGYTIFIMNTVKSSGAVYGNLLDGFGMAGRVIWLELLRGLIIGLGFVFFIIPGILLFYSYRQALYLLIEHPEMKVRECLKESRKMMRGRKAELFGIDFSFVLWYIMLCVPYVGYAVRVWITPYSTTTYVLYYLALRGTPVIVKPVDRPGET